MLLLSAAHQSLAIFRINSEHRLGHVSAMSHPLHVQCIGIEKCCSSKYNIMTSISGAYLTTFCNGSNYFYHQQHQQSQHNNRESSAVTPTNKLFDSFPPVSQLTFNLETAVCRLEIVIVWNLLKMLNLIDSHRSHYDQLCFSCSLWASWATINSHLLRIYRTASSENPLVYGWLAADGDHTIKVRHEFQFGNVWLTFLWNHFCLWNVMNFWCGHG